MHSAQFLITIYKKTVAANLLLREFQILIYDLQHIEPITTVHKSYTYKLSINNILIILHKNTSGDEYSSGLLQQGVQNNGVLCKYQ